MSRNLSELAEEFFASWRNPPPNSVHAVTEFIAYVKGATPTRAPYPGAMNDPNAPNPYVLADDGVEGLTHENATAVRWKELFLRAIGRSPLDAEGWTLNLAEHHIRQGRKGSR